MPTLAEAGFAAFDDEQWIGAWVPAKTPAALAERVTEALVQAARAPDAAQRLSATGYEVVAIRGDEMARYVRREVEKWARIAKATGARAE